MEELEYKWWRFKVYVPSDLDGEEGYEYSESEQGLTLEEAKATYRKENPDALVLAGGEEEDY